MLSTKTWSSGRPTSRRGAGMIEIMISIALFTIVMLSAMAMIESGHKFSKSTIETTAVEDLAQQMLFSMEHELSDASGFEPETEVSVTITAGQTSHMVVTSTLGFPPSGTLILDRGTGNEEKISYSGLTQLERRFRNLERGVQCSPSFSHTKFTTVTWAGLAVPTEDQVNPFPSTYDGMALEDTGPVYFRGNGTGFSYRVPIDPAGGNNPLNGDDLFWGAEVRGSGPVTTGWMAFYFEPKDAFDEAEARHDLNDDGDMLDVFDIGQIRRINWDRAVPTRFDDVAMGPSRIVQERCNWGADLDNDGFDDPIFLWDPESNQLHVRLFLVGTSVDLPIIRKVESVTFLRNTPEL